jgi:hypothetical protein
LDIARRQRRVGRMQKEMPTYKVLDEVQRISSMCIRGISTSHSSHAIWLSRQQHASSIAALRASPLSGEISSLGRPWPASSLAPRKCDVCFAAWRGDTRWPEEAEAHSTGSLDGFTLTWEHFPFPRSIRIPSRPPLKPSSTLSIPLVVHPSSSSHPLFVAIHSIEATRMRGS